MSTTQSQIGPTGYPAPVPLAALSLDPEELLRTFGTLGLFAIVFAESGLLIGFFAVLGVIGAIGVTLSEMRDRPVRRAERLAREQAEAAN